MFIFRQRTSPHAYSILRWMAAALSTAMIAVCVACVDEPPATKQVPTFEPQPTPTVPPDFVVYTDHAGVFSFQYPQDWRLNVMPELPELPALYDDLPLQFMASVVDPRGQRNVSILVEALPNSMSVDEFAESSIAFIRRDLGENVDLLSRRPFVAGGLEAQMLSLEIDSPEIGHRVGWALVTVDPIRDLGWTINCYSDVPAPESTEPTCLSVLSSFTLTR